MKKSHKTPEITPSNYFPQSVPNPQKGEVNPSTGMQTSMIVEGKCGAPYLDPYGYSKKVIEAHPNEEMK